MKFLRIGLICALVMAFVPVFASAQQESKSFKLDQKVIVGNQQLKPGHYQLKWDDASSNPTVTFYRDNKEVASAPAHLVHQKNVGHDNYEINTATGQNKLDRIYMADTVLDFGGAQQSSAVGSQSGSQSATPPSQ